jgi:hypothetical protein
VEEEEKDLNVEVVIVAKKTRIKNVHSANR